jgi:hypothetical protein
MTHVINCLTLDQVQHVSGRLRRLPLHPGKLLRVLLQ